MPTTETAERGICWREAAGEIRWDSSRKPSNAYDRASPPQVPAQTELSDKNAPWSSGVGLIHPGVSRENLNWILGACFFKKSFRVDVGLHLIQIKRNARHNKQLACVGINSTVIKAQEIQLPKMRVPASRHIKELPGEVAEHAFISLCRCCNYFSMQFLYCPWHCIIQYRDTHGFQYNPDTVINLSASLKLIIHYQNSN